MADYHSLLMRAVANLPSAGTPATRQAIYGRARKALLEQLRSLRPPLPESDIGREESALDAAIAQIEARFAAQEEGAPSAAPSPPAGSPSPPPAGKTTAAATSPSPKPATPNAQPQPPTFQRSPAPAAPHGPSTPGAPTASAASQRAPSPTAPQGPPGPSPSAPVQSAAPQRPSPGARAQGQPAQSATPQPPIPPAGKPAAVAPAGAASAPHARPAPVATAVKPPQPAVGPKAGLVAAKDAKAESSPAASPLDLTKAVRSTKADDGHASGAPPVVVTRPDEPVQAVGAPEVPSEVDRPGSAARQDLGGQRPVAPGVDAGKPQTWLWIAAAVVLGIVIAVAGVAILMRQKPQDLAIKPPAEAQQPAAAQPPAKIAERVEPPLASPASPPAPASEPKGDQSSAQGAAAPASPATAAQNPPAAPTPPAGRAAMLVASADNPQKPVVSLGSTVWSLLPPAPGQPATVAVKADADIPDLKMHATMTLRKNTDPTLQATHTIDLKFSFADGAPITGFKDVGLPQMRKEDSTAAETLTSVKVKISDVYFLIALAKGDSDTARNLDLMQTRAWFDFPLLLNDNRIAKVVFQKSPEGEAMLAKAFDAWK